MNRILRFAIKCRKRSANRRVHQRSLRSVFTHGRGNGGKKKERVRDCNGCILMPPAGVPAAPEAPFVACYAPSGRSRYQQKQLRPACERPARIICCAGLKSFSLWEFTTDSNSSGPHIL